jgi:hypothetical protein
MNVLPFVEVGNRKELARRLSAIGFSIPDEALKGRPKFGLSLLLEPAQLDEFVRAFDWVLSEIENAENVGATPS